MTIKLQIILYLDFDKSFCSLDLGFTKGSSVFGTHISAHCQIGRLIEGLKMQRNKRGLHCLIFPLPSGFRIYLILL